jgi:hypothetical protein
MQFLSHFVSYLDNFIHPQLLPSTYLIQYHVSLCAPTLKLPPTAALVRANLISIP